MLKAIYTVVIGFFCVVNTACVNNGGVNGGNGYLDSSAVTKQIHSKIIDKLGPQGMSIRVRAYLDEVMLSGQVANADVRQQAGEIAASVGNVKYVRNDLVVK
jgi:osmotically-inducible protein OsmY